MTVPTTTPQERILFTPTSIPCCTPTQQLHGIARPWADATQGRSLFGKSVICAAGGMRQEVRNMDEVLCTKGAANGAALCSSHASHGCSP
jgi:hypothetical protein